MEILIVVAIWTVVVKRGVEDILHVARGNTPDRYKAASARRTSGAAGRYWSTLKEDVFSDLLAKHIAGRAKRQATPSTPRPRGAATQFFAGWFQDGRRAAGRKWAGGWTRADEKRREKATRPRPGQDTVPGEVVPNADEPPMYVKDGRDWGNCDTCGQRMVLLPYQTTCAWCTYQRFGGESNPDAMRLTVDEAKRWTAGPSQDGGEFMCLSCGKRPAVPSTLWCSSCTPSQDGDGDRPQDGDGPEPHVVRDEDGRTDLRFGDDPTDPTGTKQCPECRGTVLVDGEVCLSCRDRQEQRNQHRDDQDEEPPPCPKCLTTMTTAPNIGDPMSYDGKGIYRCPRCDYKIRRSTEPTDDFTQEGTTMTATTTEVVGLDSAIRFCEDSARAYRAQIQAIEQTQAALAAGDVTGPAAETFSQAMEQSNLAAASMDSAAAELLRHKQVQEAYLANQGAGTRDFILAGQ